MARVDVGHGSDIYIGPSPHNVKRGYGCKWTSTLLWHSTCISALKVQLTVIRNAAGSIACAWLANGCYFLGNIFSGKSSREQTQGELIVANSVWAMITFCSIIFFARLHPMISLRFISAPDYRPSLWFCFRKLIRRTFIYFLAVIAFTFGFSRLLAYLAIKSPQIFAYKLECYSDNFALLAYFTGVAVTTKVIFYRETIQGRDRLVKREREKKPRAGPVEPTTETLASAYSRGYRTPKLWCEYVKNLPKGAPPIVATVFVHVLSRQKLIDQRSAVLYCFVVASVLCKLAIQEGAKHYILHKRVRSVRTMCVLVGVPTVLIDTQTRIILLGSNSTKTATVGTLGMALVEICLRVGKSMLVMWSIRRRKRKIHSQVSVSSCSEKKDALEPQGRRRSISHMFSIIQLASIITRDDFELWRRQVQAFHTAELNADMYAEYIAIGCSASILFFYGDHPRYSLLRESDSAKSKADVAAWCTSQMYMLAFQVVVEVIVDYVSIVLEMKIGIEYDSIQRLGSFLAVLFMVAAVMNINISVGVYLS